MWLIHTSSLELKWFHSCRDGCPPYAILSHTWDNEEITFQDLRHGAGIGSRGHMKVVEMCRLARESGLAYAWVDTCCIDKSSSAELSEAINSMWEWYFEARICYVHLSDVAHECDQLHDDEDSEDDEDDEINLQTSGSKAFAVLSRCRWFTRGFTLQELLAPSNIVFLGQTWRKIGKKTTLLSTLSKITGIEQRALRERKSISSFSIATKLSWAANRRTTREEDRSYSLLGILGVNLPLLYGEGSKAFIRLQEELIRTTTDQSIFAWEALDVTTDQPVFERQVLSFDLLAPSPDNFRSSRRILPHPDPANDAAYRLTNFGVELDSMPIVHEEHEAFVILNCRYDDDLRGRIALRLRGNNLRHGSESTGGLPAGHFHVDPSRSILLGDPMDSNNWFSKSGRIGVMNERHSSVAVRMSGRMTILLQIPHTSFSPWNGTSNARKVWLDLESTPAMYIHQVYPSRRWNAQSGIMIGLTQPSTLHDPLYSGKIVGSALIRSREQGQESFHHNIAFQFGYQKRRREKDTIGKYGGFSMEGFYRPIDHPAQEELRILWSQVDSQERLRSRLDSIAPCSEAWSADRTLVAEVSRITLWGDIVYWIRVRSNKPSGSKVS